MNSIDYNQNFKIIDFRKAPELYRVGIGEQGVLLVEPYKSELLPSWRFRTAEIAQKSSVELLTLFDCYAQNDDFIGMDMARKFIQMGFTRSRRYANHKSGKKYDGPVPADKKGMSGAHGRTILKSDPDNEKAKSAKIFKKAWDQVESHQKYKEMKREWKFCFG